MKVDPLKKSGVVARLAETTFAYRAGDPVLDIAELTVAAGEKLFVEGPSGSGKSTLLGLLGGILTPSAGTVEVHGETLSAMSAAARDRFRAEHVGFVFQMFNLLPYLSVAENVALPCRFSAQRAEAARRGGSSIAGEARRLLQRLGLAGEDLLERPVTSLSIGQQQRVAVARALIGRPALLVADEPTAALDAGNRERFVRLLMEECDAAGSAAVFVSHDPSLAASFDRSVSLPELNRVHVEAADE